MTTLTLYALADQLAQTLDQVNEDGELPEGYEDIRLLVANKAANVAAYVAQRELEVKAMEDRLAEVAKRVKAQKNRCERLREYLLYNMQRAGISEINSHDLLLSVKRLAERDEAVEILDEAQIPAVYMNVPEPPAPRPDKAAIRRALKAGQDVPGAKLIKRDRLVIA